MKDNKLNLNLELAESITVNTIAEVFDVFQKIIATHPENLTLNLDEVYEALTKAQGKALLINKLAKEIIPVAHQVQSKETGELTPRVLFNVANDIAIEAHSKHDCENCPAAEECSIRNVMLIAKEYRNYEPDINEGHKKQMVDALSGKRRPLPDFIAKLAEQLGKHVNAHVHVVDMSEHKGKSPEEVILNLGSIFGKTNGTDKPN